jgi:serine/threonine protein kinase
MDPEYLRTGQVSFGSDCYSFGVLLLQMITGRPPESNETPLQEHVEDALRYVGSALSLSPPPRLHPRRLSPWAPLTLFVCEVEVCASLCRSLTRGGCVSSHSTERRTRRRRREHGQQTTRRSWLGWRCAAPWHAAETAPT